MSYKGVVFDWAGTMVDFGSFAPMGAFVEAFAAFQVTPTIEEARAPMGMAKRDHIEAMVKAPRLSREWTKVRGQGPTQADIDEIYKVFVPLNEKVAAKHAKLVPGAKDVVSSLRRRGLKIGSTTGYTRSIMEHVIPVAAEQGYMPDNVVCSDDLKEGRPGPLGMYKCCVDLCVHPVTSLIKVDDTVPGIQEGASAGCLTIGVALSGNYVGLTVDELKKLDDATLELNRAFASQKLIEAGADHVIDTVADLPSLLNQLNIIQTAL